MGNIKRILSEKKIESVPLYWNTVRIEAGEEELIHFHWRDLRILLRPTTALPGIQTQFERFATCVSGGYKKWINKLEQKFTKNKDIYIDVRKVPDEIIFDNTMKLEEQMNGQIHFHYRDTRYELIPHDFLQMADLFAEARLNYVERWDRMIDLSEINPYDKAHFPNKDDWKKKDYEYHEEGINLVVEGLKNGGQILPIMICPRVMSKEEIIELSNTELIDIFHRPYQRLDGYKRYMGYKRFGFKKIPCFIGALKDLPWIRQHQRPWWIVKPER